MAYRNSPRIVTDGLVTYLDSTNLKSYPNAGTTWYDMIRRYAGSMSAISWGINSSFSFNGASSVATYTTVDLAVNNFTMEAWCFPNATLTLVGESQSGITGIGGQRYIIGATQRGGDRGVGLSVGTNGVCVFEHGPGNIYSLLTWAGTLSSFTNILVTYTNKEPRLYINGVLVRTGLTGTSTSWLNLLEIGTTATYGYYSGYVGPIHFYNRILTTSEIERNHNALRGRYGI